MISLGFQNAISSNEDLIFPCEFSKWFTDVSQVGHKTFLNTVLKPQRIKRKMSTVVPLPLEWQLPSPSSVSLQTD